MAHRMNRVADAPRPTAPGKAGDVGGLVWIGAVLRGEPPLEAAAPRSGDAGWAAAADLLLGVRGCMV